MNNLKPGPEMDAMIAEKVMGLTSTGEKSNYGERFKTKWPQGDIIHLSMDYAESLVPRYSTDIAAAWVILEEFWYPSVSFNQKNGKWKCSLSAKAVLNMKTGLVDKSVHWAYDYSAPMAICRAALAAKENLLKEN